MSDGTPTEHLRRLVASRGVKRKSFDATNNWDSPPAIMFYKPITRTMDCTAREATQLEFPATWLPEGYRGMYQDPAHSHTYGYDWNKCSLCRSSRQALDTLNRTLKRRVDWSERPLPSQEAPLSEEVMTQEEVLRSLVQLLGETAKCCKSYHRGAVRSAPCSPLSNTDSLHCRRYHTPQVHVTSHNKTTQDTRLTVALPRGEYSLERVPCPPGDPSADRHVLINFSI